MVWVRGSHQTADTDESQEPCAHAYITDTDADEQTQVCLAGHDAVVCTEQCNCTWMSLMMGYRCQLAGMKTSAAKAPRTPPMIWKPCTRSDELMAARHLCHHFMRSYA